jgi:hypothetical protein
MMATVAIAFVAAPRLGLEKPAFAYGVTVTTVVLALTVAGGLGWSDQACSPDRADRQHRTSASGCREFTVSLQRQTEAGKLGLSVVGFEKRALKIERIGAGLAEAWNDTHPGARVAVGDCIVAVNGTRGHPEEMFARLRESTVLELVIERLGPEPPRTPVAPRLERGEAGLSRPGPPQACAATPGEGAATRSGSITEEPDEILQHLALFADASRKGQAAAEQEDPLWSSDWTDVAGAMLRQPPAEALPAEVFAIDDTPTWLAGMHKRRDQASRAGKKKLAQRISREIEEALRLHPALAGGTPASLAAGLPPGGPHCDDHPDDADPESVESIYGVDWSRLGAERSVHVPPAVVAS